MSDEWLNRWKVNATGYRWVLGEPDISEPVYRRPRSEFASAIFKRSTPESYLVSKPPPGTEPETWTYDPFSVEPALFRTFAGTEPDRRGVARFANSFGLLGDGTRINAQDSETRAHLKGSLIGEGLSVWQDHIGAMREMLTLWDIYTSGDVEALSRLIRWDDRNRWVSYC